MPCPRPTFKQFLFPNTCIVFATIFLGDIFYSWYVTGSFGSYFGKDFVWKFVYTALLAFLYAWLYTRASRIWRDGNPPQASPENGSGLDPSVTPFWLKKELRAVAVSCNGTGHKIFNGMLFSLLFCSICFFALMLCSLMLVSIYIFVLHGIRGDLTVDAGAAVVKTVEIVTAGVLLERHGKTESDGDP